MYLILYSHQKNVGYMLMGIKTIPRPQGFYSAGTPPPVLKFLDPPLKFDLRWILFYYNHFIIK